MDPLPRAFFARETPTVARELLGHHVVVAEPGAKEPLVARIVETEAYVGPDDPGSHARLGRHTRAGRLWEDPGTAYVYVSYGVHDMLNVVAHRPGEVGGVLLRAGEPVAGTEAMQLRRGDVPSRKLLAGPGNLAKALGLSAARHDGADLTRPPVHLAHGALVPPERVAVTGRIGLSAGGELLLRFVDEESPSLSRPVPGGPR